MYLTAKNIRPRGVVDLTDITFVSRDVHNGIYARCPVERGDVLYIKDGATTGRAAVNPFDEPFSMLSSVALLKPSQALDPAYLCHWLNSPAALADMLGEMSGSAIKRLTLGKIQRQRLPIPPLAEQRRIVAKLDALTARTAPARADLDRIPMLAATFKRQVLGAAMKGELFAGGLDSPGGDTVPLARAISRLRTGPFGSALHKHEYVAGGVPLINPMHINNGRLTPSRDTTVREAKAAELGEFRLSPGDVVIARRGVMGRCAVATSDHSGWLIGTGSMALTPGPALDANYLQLFLSSPDAVAALEANAVGTTMVNLNQGILLGLAMRLPRIEEQRYTVEQVRNAFAEIERLAAEAAAARRLLDRLDQAIFAKAFRGELVPQDPADEPASVLLDRIRAERDAVPVKGRRGRSAKAA